MSTRSFIGKQADDGSIRCIYCHSDGYPEYNGVLLSDQYSDPAKIDALLDLGDLSVLDKELGDKHDFNDGHITGWCLAYGRDRGETDIDARTYPSVAAFETMLAASWAEYAYLYDGTQWLMSGTNTIAWVPLTPVVETIKANDRVVS